MAFASTMSERGLVLRQNGVSLKSVFATFLPMAASRTLSGPAPKDPCRDVPAEQSALEKALARASGTWGGFQASRPFIHRTPD